MKTSDSDVAVRNLELTWNRSRCKRYLALVFWLCFFGFIFWSYRYLNIPLERFVTMGGPLTDKLSGLFLPPQVGYVRTSGFVDSIVETFMIAVFGTLVGLGICVPLSWFAALNVSPGKLSLYPLGRGLIILSRSIDMLIWAILFTMILGFGPLPGALASMLGTIGFSGKLMAEEIENINLGPVEAVRATGAGELKVFLYGILPQIKVAWTGISIYSWDSTFRGATILGYVGAGGIGMYLRETIQMLEYGKTGMTLVVIIGLVIASEVVSAWLRKRIT